MPENTPSAQSPGSAVANPLFKPLVIAATLAATTACAWAGLTAYTSRSVETTLNAEYDKLAELPFVKVLARRFDRGFTSSTSEMRLAIGWPERTLPGANGARAGFEMTVRHRITNGPITGDGLAAALVETELVVPEAAKAQVAAIFDDRAPLSAITRVAFSGDSKTTIEMAPVRMDDSVIDKLVRAAGAPGTREAQRAAAGWQPGTRLEWQGLKAVYELSADRERITYHGSFLPFSASNPDGGKFAMGEATFEGKGKRVEGWLYDDANTMKMQSIQMLMPVPNGAPAVSIVMSDITGVSTTDVKDGFLGQKQKLRFGSMKIGEREIGRLDYDTSVDRLHVQTLTDGVKAVLAKRPFDCIGLPEAQLADCFAPSLEVLKPALFSLLEHGPRFAVDRLALVVPEGEARIGFAVTLGALKEADFDNPQQILEKIGVIANASFGEAVIGKFAAMAMAQASGGQTPPPEQLNAMIEQGVLPLVSQGFINRADGKLSTSFEMRSGALMINGKPIDPGLTASAMGALAQSRSMDGKPARRSNRRR